MPKKRKKKQEGAPEWVITYGDMMSLLLVFFIMLVSISEIKKKDEFRVISEEIRKAFGQVGGGAKIPSKRDPELSLIKRLEELQLVRRPEKARSNTTQKGMRGREWQVKTVRDGLIFTKGGRVTFEVGSADLSEEARFDLQTVADLVRGSNNKIEVRGHASPMEAQLGAIDLPGYGPVRDLDDLAYARAKAVRDFLISRQIGIRPERIVMSSAADHEPLVARKYEAEEHAQNRRAEIMLRESVIEDYTPGGAAAPAASP